jgi:transcriptional regulator with XRE-family HTH domain
MSTVKGQRLQWTIRSTADLGRAIAGARSANGLTQQQLAEEAAVDRSYLARLEAGASKLVLERALRLLRRLDATVTVTLPQDDEREE